VEQKTALAKAAVGEVTFEQATTNKAQKLAHEKGFEARQDPKWMEERSSSI